MLLLLLLQVVAPMLLGQSLRYIPPHIWDVPAFVVTYRKVFKRISETMLAFLVYTTFSDTFFVGTDATAEQIVALVGLLLAIHVTHLAVVWWGSGFPQLKCNAPDRVAILFCSTQKTLALGIPLINTIYAGSDNIGLYCLPLLIYHPMQMIIGTGLLSYLREFVLKQAIKERDKIKSFTIEMK